MTAAYEHDGDLTREQILASVMTFAKKAAWRAHSKAPAATELDELYALALFGIAQADARFDSYCAEHGYNPEVLSHYRTYLTWRMNGAIMDALRAADWMTRSARTDLKAITAGGRGRRLRAADGRRAGGPRRHPRGEGAQGPRAAG
jgi:RNA polymerase sigma factor for flagellar operon FliA